MSGSDLNNLNETLDTTNALAGVVLWLVFGFMSTMINCDIQRLVKHNVIFTHASLIVIIFFLFTIIDTTEHTSMNMLLVKTILVYIAFIMLTKSKWYFVIPVVLLITLDQYVKKDLEIRTKQGQDVTAYMPWQQWLNKYVNISAFIIVTVGMIHYATLQMAQHGTNFSWFKFVFVFGTCRDT